MYMLESGARRAGDECQNEENEKKSTYGAFINKHGRLNE